MEIYRQAKARDPVYMGAVNALRAARERVPQARAALLPAVSLVGATSRQAGQASFSEAPYGDRDVRNRSWNLQLTQPLWRSASWAALDQAEQQELLAEAQFRHAEQDLILRTTQAYLDVLVAQEAQRVARLQVGAVIQQLELARRNFEVGMATVTDVHEAKSRFDLARAQRISAVNELQNKRADLERVPGEAPGTLAGLRQDAQVPGPQPAELDTWIANAKTQYPLVRIQEAAEEVAAKEIERNRAAHLPTLDLTASYGKTYTSGSITSPADIAVRNRVGQIGLQLSVPLYSGGGINSRVREAVANLGKARAELDDARRQAAALARQAHAGIANGQAQIEALVSAVESSKSSVEANKIGYKIGTRINIDVLNAEQQLYAAQRDLSKSRAETLMNGLRLKASTGALEIADVEALNGLLEPATE